jgi:hypothetical protein
MGIKNSVTDHALHQSYVQLWTAMAELQNPPPYGGIPRPKFIASWISIHHRPKDIKA